jgi:hypothetical protein
VFGLRVGRTFSTRGHTHNVFNVVMDPGGRLLVSGADDGLVKLWSLADGRLLRTLRGCAGAVVETCFSANGNFLAMGAEGPQDGVAVFELPLFRRRAWLPQPRGVSVKLLSKIRGVGLCLE